MTDIVERLCKRAVVECDKKNLDSYYALIKAIGAITTLRDKNESLCKAMQRILQRVDLDGLGRVYKPEIEAMENQLSDIAALARAALKENSDE